MSIVLGTNSHGKRLDLSLDYAIESSAIIARKGLGKTHTAKCIIEDLQAGHVQTVVIDPLDVWWGLRLAANGKGAGCDVVIFGGEHADLPLTETMGVLLADLVVDREISAVFVLDHLSKSAMRRFTADFCEHLYARKTKHRTPLHIVIDECDIFIPQKPPPEAYRCLGVVDSMVRHGRSRGLGSTVISQRPAIINKDVLTQTECLITLGLTSPQDRKAVLEWIEAQASVEQAKEFLTSLAGMERGDAWVWSPSRFKVFERIKVRAARTYDSSYTPTVGAKRREAPKLSPVDLERIKGEMASVIEEQRENDPKALKARIKELEKQVNAKGNKRSVNQAELRELVEEALHPIKVSLTTAERERDEAAGALRKIRAMCDASMPSIISDTSDDSMRPDSPRHRKHVQEIVDRGTRLGPAEPRITAAEVKQRAAALVGSDDTSMKPSQRKILVVLAQHYEHHPGEALLKSMLAVRAGYSLGGTFDSLISTLRTRNFVEAATAKGSLRITGEGLAAIGDFERMPMGAALREWWKQRLKPSQCRILDALTDTHLAKAHLAQRVGYALGGTFDSLLSTLRSKGLITGERGEPLDLHPDLKD
jgi:hypothetical protein